MGGQLELAFLKGIGGREARETLLNSTDHHGNARRGPGETALRTRQGDAATIRPGTGRRQALGGAREPGPCRAAAAQGP